MSKYSEIIKTRLTPEQVKEVEAIGRARDWEISQTVRNAVAFYIETMHGSQGLLSLPKVSVPTDTNPAGRA